MISTAFPMKTLRFGYVGNPSTFLPSEAQTDVEKGISKLLFRQLYKYDNGELKPDLVDGIDVSDDYLTYTIRIKQNQKWEDGEEITSNDIIYSITKYESLIKNMSIEKMSNYEIKILLKTPVATLPSFLTFGIEPSHIKNNQKLQPVNSTSFKVSRIDKEQNITRKIELVSFQKDKQFNRLIFNFYNEEKDLQTAYQLGEIDAFLSKTPPLINGLKAQDIAMIGRQYTLIFNTTKTSLETLEIRKTLAEALDIEKLIKENHFFEKSLISQGPISYSYATKDVFKSPLYKPDTKLTVSQKKELTSLTIILPNNDEGQQIKSFIQESWGKNLELELVFKFLDMKELLTEASDGNFDALFIGLETTPDPDRYNYWHSTQINDGFNLGYFEDPRADKALEEGRKVKSEEERIKHYNIFQDVMYTKTPAIFLYHPGTTLYLSEKINLDIPKMIYYPWDIFQNL